MGKPTTALNEQLGAGDLRPAPARRLNPAELKIDILCSGIRIGESFQVVGEGRPLVRTRAGLGSGLEMVIPGRPRDVWVNAPVVESFAARSRYLLQNDGKSWALLDESAGHRYPVSLAPKPQWYDRRTSGGALMSRIATLQGTCLSIYIGETCRFWSPEHPLNCKFCTTGLNVGRDEEAEKSVQDVVETALAAKAESGVTFVHFNSGYQGARGLTKVFPYVEAVKSLVGLLVGVQFIPEQDFTQYDTAIRLGVDHFSFCFEFYNIDYFRRYLPGKTTILGRDIFLRAMEYTSRKMGKGRVSGEIIAGIEPLQDTFRAIEYIVRAGAFPFVCIFRPLIGSQMENYPPPSYGDMLRVFQHVYRTCRNHNLPVGIAPNIKVSLSLQPDDTLYLSEGKARDRFYLAWMELLRSLMRPYFARRMRPRASNNQ
ncbi:MAG: hypothetical protein HXY20_07805 [Acidobacteria bacterium]|nr:hypothetical protein [Acidobacteriota bacterium]